MTQDYVTRSTWLVAETEHCLQSEGCVTRREMGKWIRDRLRRRRKKTGASARSGENPPPLQPNFLANEMAAGPPEAEPEPVHEDDNPEPTTALPAGAAAAGQPPAAKRRRRRGRRGRGGRGPVAPGAQSAPLRPAYPEPAESGPPPVLQQAAEPESRPATRPHPAAAPAAQPRRPKGVVVLAIGLPGSGKSTWFKRRQAIPLSSDVIRSMLFDDVTEQRFQDLVFSTLRSLLRARLVARMPVNYVDATNLSPHDRRGWIKMAHDFGYEVQAVFFDVPTEVCIERNRRRDRVVPEEVMQRMAGKLRPPKFDEGFSKITVVRVKRTGEGEPAESSQGDSEPQDR